MMRVMITAVSFLANSLKAGSRQVRILTHRFKPTVPLNHEQSCAITAHTSEFQSPSSQ